mmetsp:Transcript_22549/g.58345  ORF Transcript_22549/g.58345 Transcript_22549/m.58345 type:complete len:929 (+) Transcript_22549:384-3170(+)|eukprot:CAMPEP_0119473122 /NCGR_PEP_ID=MMETSP1344-20130328/4899_1 /TAXON_ID=236787 /ORGANISM="Florenciella parvula, Strain CCMP2471" /LENGTH=928 /DNA_ID=CAMNT_0007506177 /DNA_START=394 /DNA_END=3180 /DNA_ORIENTATION=-
MDTVMETKLPPPPFRLRPDEPGLIFSGRSRVKTKNGGVVEPEPHRQAEQLAQEVEEGNTEYKLKLVSVPADRIRHLATQMDWRLKEGKGSGADGADEALYQIGFQDNGFPQGLSDKDLDQSLRTLQVMASGVGAHVIDVELMLGHEGRVATVRVRRDLRSGDALGDSLAQDDAHCAELRIATAGDAGGGKSTLAAVLTTGELDNGRGLARMQVLRHNHEFEDGHTSSISQVLLGFDADGGVANYDSSTPSCLGGISAEPDEILKNSTKLLTFLDLAGHPKYLKTTVEGLVGHAPDYVMLVIDAHAHALAHAESDAPQPSKPPPTAIATAGTAGTGGDDSSSEGDNESGGGPARGGGGGLSFGGPTDSGHIDKGIGKMSREHLRIALALSLPIFVVVTKCDLVGPSQLDAALASLKVLLAAAKDSHSRNASPRLSPRNSPVAINTLSAAKQPYVVDSKAGVDHAVASWQSKAEPELVPIVLVSSVTGAGLSLLNDLLFRLPSPESAPGTPRYRGASGDNAECTRPGQNRSSNASPATTEPPHLSLEDGPIAVYADSALADTTDVKTALSQRSAGGFGPGGSSSLEASAFDTAMLSQMGFGLEADADFDAGFDQFPREQGGVESGGVESGGIESGGVESGGGVGGSDSTITVVRIDNSFWVDDVGLVVAGTVHAGTATGGTPMQLGPDQQGQFHTVVITSIHVNGSPAKTAVGGQSATFAVASAAPQNGGTGGSSSKRLETTGGSDDGANDSSAISDGSTCSVIGGLKHKGMVLLSPSASCRAAPLAAFEFTAEVVLLHHPATINVKYEPVVHVHTISQCAQITAIHWPAEEEGDSREGLLVDKTGALATAKSAAAAAADDDEHDNEQRSGQCAEGKADSPAKGTVIREGQRATVRFKFLYKPEYVTPGDALLFREGCARGIGKIIDVHG